MRERYTKTESFEIWYEDGIVYQVFGPGTVLNIDLARQVVSERLKVSNGVSSPIFIDLTNVFYTDTKARKYMATKEAVQYIIAGAFLLDNEIMKLAGNIFIQIDKPLIPTKLFTDKDKALLWLQDYKQV